jgi:hypothetical protein
MSEPDLSQQIQDAADSPARASVDGTSADARSISELIEADKYLAARRARKSSVLPVRIAKTRPPGIV